MLTLEQMTPEQKLGRVLCCRRMAEQDDIDFTLEQYCAAKPEHPIPVPDNANHTIRAIREHFPRKLYGYNTSASQPHAIEVLAGKYPAKGINPFARICEEFRRKQTP